MIVGALYCGISFLIGLCMVTEVCTTSFSDSSIICLTVIYVRLNNYNLFEEAVYSLEQNQNYPVCWHCLQLKSFGS